MKSITILRLSVGFAVLLVGFFCSACQKNSYPQKNATEEEQKLMQSHTQENWHDGTEVFFVLNTQQIMPVQKQTPQTFYVKGIIKDGEFSPKSGVLGVGDLATEKDGRYGWLELSSREFYPMESDRKAITPFVKGYLTNKGFVPSHRDVFDEP